MPAPLSKILRLLTPTLIAAQELKRLDGCRFTPAAFADAQGDGKYRHIYASITTSANSSATKTPKRASRPATKEPRRASRSI